MRWTTILSAGRMTLLSASLGLLPACRREPAPDRPGAVATTPDGRVIGPGEVLVRIEANGKGRVHRGGEAARGPGHPYPFPVTTSDAHLDPAAFGLPLPQTRYPAVYEEHLKLARCGPGRHAIQRRRRTV